MANPLPLAPGDPDHLGPYELIGRLGVGGQGTVYLARRDGAEQVAIKLLHTRLLGDDHARARFVRELAVLQRVAGFCTAQMLDADVAGDQPYIVSEYVPGPSLQQLVHTQGPRTGADLDRLAIGSVTALAAIHRAGIVHRDLKPHNVLIGPDGPRVIDFGIARALDAGATLTSQIVGTPAYMAPEQFSNASIGPSADLFAWGATVVFAATAQDPFGGGPLPAVMYRVLNDNPNLSALPPAIAEVVAACMAKDPHTRPTAEDTLLWLLGQRDTQPRWTLPPTSSPSSAASESRPGTPPPAGGEGERPWGNPQQATGAPGPPGGEPGWGGGSAAPAGESAPPGRDRPRAGSPPPVGGAAGGAAYEGERAWGGPQQADSAGGGSPYGSDRAWNGTPRAPDGAGSPSGGEPGWSGGSAVPGGEGGPSGRERGPGGSPRPAAGAGERGPYGSDRAWGGTPPAPGGAGSPSGGEPGWSGGSAAPGGEGDPPGRERAWGGSPQPALGVGEGGPHGVGGPTPVGGAAGGAAYEGERGWGSPQQAGGGGEGSPYEGDRTWGGAPPAPGGVGGPFGGEPGWAGGSAAAAGESGPPGGERGWGGSPQAAGAGGPYGGGGAWGGGPPPVGGAAGGAAYGGERGWGSPQQAGGAGGPYGGDRAWGGGPLGPGAGGASTDAFSGETSAFATPVGDGVGFRRTAALAVGLVLAALLAVLDIASLALFVADPELSKGEAVYLVAAAAFGLLAMVTVVAAVVGWRGSRGAVWTIIFVRLAREAIWAVWAAVELQARLDSQRQVQAYLLHLCFTAAIVVLLAYGLRAGSRSR